jgi:hypothetical protein
MTTSLKCRLEKSLLVPFIAAALLTTSAFNGNAQSTNKALIGDTEVTISFKGMEGNLLLLLVQFENPQEDRYLVQIQAQNNDSEYKEVYKGPVYSKLFKLPADEGNLKLKFKNLNSKANTTFVTSSVERMYKDVEIKLTK